MKSFDLSEDKPRSRSIIYDLRSSIANRTSQIVNTSTQPQAAQHGLEDWMHLAVIRLGSDKHQVKHLLAVAQRQSHQPITLAQGIAALIFDRRHANHIGRFGGHAVDAYIFIVPNLF